MNIKRIFSLIFTLVILTSCADTDEKLKFQESDKKKLILQENILSKEYLKTAEFKNHLYSKAFDTITLETTYEYESELWKQNKMIGGFIATTYLHPISDLNDMDEYFLAYIAGHNFEEFISPNFRYERTYEFELPYEKYRIYKIFKNDTLNMGFAFNILKENKIIFTSIVTNDKFELEIEELINRVNKI
ncbi:hypothetical protein M8845_18895 [Gelidibacter japonicus]|uniref:hypothetical protein n=1 Tax=Gelidibacter japonicus TaxID=1962232 RepID=UPI00202196DC|nr:hypothetical protein [Gelidibacter japonicus]MCL8009496.1 hypothetical protein [Gelidibacter japonicus]